MPEPTLDERVHGSPMLRRLQLNSRRLSHALARLVVTGADRVPDAGGLIIAINHRSMLDGPFLFGFTHRPVSCLVKAESFDSRLRPILVNAGQIPVVRDTVDPRPVRLCLDIVRAGGVIGVFPEATRGDGLVRTAKPGVGYFALRTGAPVLPVAATGTYEMAHRRGVRRPLATLTFGELIRVDRAPDDVPLNRRVVAAVTEQIRVRLAALVAEADARAAALSAMRAFQEDAEVAS
jgi:1-acyl-sn-glycerol-3-phosphate acyltransferase